MTSQTASLNRYTYAIKYEEYPESPRDMSDSPFMMHIDTRECHLVEKGSKYPDFFIRLHIGYRYTADDAIEYKDSGRLYSAGDMPETYAGFNLDRLVEWGMITAARAAVIRRKIDRREYSLDLAREKYHNAYINPNDDEYPEDKTVYFNQEERARIFSYLKGELEELSAYHNGEVFYYSITDTETGETVDSCGGFYGQEYCEEEAATAAARLNRQWDNAAGYAENI